MSADLNWTSILRDGPEAHGLEQCRHCNGYGSSLKEASDRCTRCGGTGLVPLGSQGHQDQRNGSRGR
jgi:DnaJ-class molecular chaperone